MEGSESCMEWVNTFNVPTMLTVALMVFNPVQAMHMYTPLSLSMAGTKFQHPVAVVGSETCAGHSPEEPILTHLMWGGVLAVAWHISGDSPRPGPVAWRRGGR